MGLFFVVCSLLRTLPRAFLPFLKREYFRGCGAPSQICGGTTHTVPRSHGAPARASVPISAPAAFVRGPCLLLIDFSIPEMVTDNYHSPLLTFPSTTTSPNYDGSVSLTDARGLDTENLRDQNTVNQSSLFLPEYTACFSSDSSSMPRREMRWGLWSHHDRDWMRLVKDNYEKRHRKRASAPPIPEGPGL